MRVSSSVLVVPHLDAWRVSIALHSSEHTVTRTLLCETEESAVATAERARVALRDELGFPPRPE